MKKGLRAIVIVLCSFAAASIYGQCPDSVIVYTSNFELGPGGLVEGGYGDWEYGSIPTMLLDSVCTNLFNDPVGAHSGNNGWATVLKDCYANSADTSWVQLTVDLSDPTYVSAELDYWSWWDVNTNFDYIFIRVNGVQVYLNNSTNFSQTWLHQVVDLTPFLGQPVVEIRFHLYATTVVNKAGWYIDDVKVKACLTSPVNIAEQGTDAIRVWPNPADDIIFIRPGTSDADHVGWTLIDAVGRVVDQGRASAVNGTFSIPVEHLSGPHILEWRTSMSVHRERMILR